jgi:hypothetical protein
VRSAKVVSFAFSCMAGLEHKDLFRMTQEAQRHLGEKTSSFRFEWRFSGNG